MRVFWFGLALSLLMLVSSPTFAGDYANLRFLGFSQDGNYLAFEEWGEADGIGGMYAKTYVVNTVKNDFAIKPLTFREDSEKPAAAAKISRKKYELAAANALRRFKIVQGNTGRLIVSQLLTDWTFDDNFTSASEDSKVKFNSYMNPNSPNQYEFYEISLKTIPDEKTECNNRTERGVFKLDLTLNYTGSSAEYNYSQVLQKDTALPAERNCPYSYKIESVYFYDDIIAVFLNVFSHGFEGPDMRYMVVTAQLEREPTQYDYFKNKK